MLEPARTLFAEVLEDADLTALLFDSAGDQLAGSYLDAGGREIGGEIGATLTGISGEVARAMRHLEIGEWHALVIETSDATLALAPGNGDSIVFVAASAEEPHGLVRRVLSRSADRANHWLSESRGQ